MKSRDEILKLATTTIDIESKAIENLKYLLNEDFPSIVSLLYNNNGRVIITGVGKSAIVANKLVATFNSTGTPAIFMHAADAIHGDIGIIQKDDIVLCLSKSGNTPEIKVLIPLLRAWGNKLIAIVGNMDSFLAREADYVINSTVDKEACPNNLAPTSSTTAQMVMGDALAVALLSCRDFSRQDFAKYHPGGALGKQLYLTAGDICAQHEAPSVLPGDNLKKIIMEISSKRLGAAVVSDGTKLYGIITDGDLRRMLQKNEDFLKITAQEIMSPNPKTIQKDTLATDALQLMREHNISQVIVLDGEKYAGMVHIHDLVKEGLSNF